MVSAKNKSWQDEYLKTMKEKHQLNPLTDVRQSWWDLIAIQFAGWMGLPTLAASLLILQQNSFLGAVLTIIVGNAIMWFIRLGILSMSYEKRQSTLDISRVYLGDLGGYFISIALLVSTLAWYITQTSIGGDTLTHLISIHENPQINQFAQMSILLGLISAFLCMGGIVLLRKISVIAFPLLVITFFTILFTLPDHLPKTNAQNLSLAGLSLFLATNLGISSDLPTFFRHGKTWAESLKALAIVQIISILFGILSLYLGSIVINGFEINEQFVLASGNHILRISLVIFILISVICSNVANVYSASVGWEIVAPSALVGRKEYLILGLGLSIVFILVSNLFSTEFLLTVSDASLINLCIVLIIGYLVSKRIQKSPTRSLQNTYFIAWLLSSAVNSIQFFYPGSFSPLFLGFFIILAVLFLSFCTNHIAKNLFS